MCFNIIILLSCVFVVVSSPAPTHLLVTRIGPCYDEEASAVSISELSITTETYDSSLCGTLNVSQDINDGWKVKLTIEKCVDIRNIDSCDHFKTFFVVNYGCSGREDSEQDIYGLLFYYTTPKLECPIRAGIYKIINYPFFTEDNYVAVHESKISTSVFGYIYRVHGYTTDKKKIFCMEASLQLRYIRYHDWSITAINTTTHRSVYSNEDKNNDKEADY